MHKSVHIAFFCWIVLSCGITAQRANAASFTFAPVTYFEVLDTNLDGSGNAGPFLAGRSIGLGSLAEARLIAEFDISSFLAPPGESVVSATLDVVITLVPPALAGLGAPAVTPDSTGVYGYAGNGSADLSDYVAGSFLDNQSTASGSVGQVVSFDVTSFFSSLASSGDPFAGFTMRAEDDGLMQLGSGIDPELNIETAVVPEPAALSLLALGVLLAARRRR